MKLALTIHMPENVDDARLNSPQKKKTAVNKKFKHSGIKKIMILSIVEAIPEKYENIKKLLNTHGIESLSEDCLHFFVADYKLHNQALGLCGHGGDYCCPYCQVLL